MHGHIKAVHLLDAEVHAHEKELCNYYQNHPQVHLDEGGYTQFHISASYLHILKPSRLEGESPSPCWHIRCYIVPSGIVLSWALDQSNVGVGRAHYGRVQLNGMRGTKADGLGRE